MCSRPDEVAYWLAQHGEPVCGPVTITRIGFGQSNITSLIRDARNREWVLREPPGGTRRGSAHDVHREAGIIAGLAGTEVPVAPVVGTGQARAGGVFFVMRRVPGTPLESEADAEELTTDQRYALGGQVITTLAGLHQVAPPVIGLAAPPTPYVQRQISRISEVWERMGSGSEHDAAWRAVRTKLVDGQPISPNPPVIMHGDYRLSNVLVDGGQLTAVLDWELCTVGDPMVDLAWLLDDWRAPGEPAIVMPSPTRVGGFPSRDEMVDRYVEATGFATTGLHYYRGFTQWRAAGLLQGVLVRRRSGAMGQHGAVDLDELDRSIATLLETAAGHLEEHSC